MLAAWQLASMADDSGVPVRRSARVAMERLPAAGAMSHTAQQCTVIRGSMLLPARPA